MNNHHNHIRLLGGIKKALAAGSVVAALLHDNDIKRGKRRAFKFHGRKRAHRGIACDVPGLLPQYARHTIGPRDYRRTWQQRDWCFLHLESFRDQTPITVAHQ